MCVCVALCESEITFGHWVFLVCVCVCDTLGLSPVFVDLTVAWDGMCEAAS